MQENCELVKCQICEQEMSFGRIKRHISVKHKEITIDQYIKNYWSTLPKHNPCEICGNNIVYNYKTCSKECHGLLISKILKNIPKPKDFMSNEHKDKIGKSNLGKIREEGVGNKISQNSKGISRNKGKQPMLGKKHSILTKNKMSIKAKISFDKGERPSIAQKGVKRSPETIEKIFKKRKMNKLEKFVSYVLDSNNIKYDFQFFIKNKEGICKSYYFKIKDSNILLEVDGDYWHGNPKLKKHFYKLDEVKKNDDFKNQLAINKGFKILRLWESDIYNQPEIIINNINNLL